MVRHSKKLTGNKLKKGKKGQDDEPASSRSDDDKHDEADGTQEDEQPSENDEKGMMIESENFHQGKESLEKTPPKKRQSSRISKNDSTPSNPTSDIIELDDESEDESELKETPVSSASQQRRSARAHNPTPVYTSKARLSDPPPPRQERNNGRLPRPTKRTLSVATKTKEKIQQKNEENAGNDEDEEEEKDFELFDAVLQGSCSTQDLVHEWRSRFDADSIAASREIINFIMNTCGSKGVCVEEHDNLDDLDLISFVDTVVQSLQASNELSYPIASRAKTFRKFKSNLAEFWTQFINECWDSEIIQSTDIVQRCIDWLTSLSSSEVRAIRHTSTYTAYVIGNTLVAHARQLRDQLVPINRQCAAVSEATKKALAKSKSKNPKVARLFELKDTYEEQLANSMTYITSLFNGVVVHRYRDIMADIRVESAQTLGSWVKDLPEDFLEDNYVKYLGWLLNDKSAKVRKVVVEALKQLYQEESNAEKLTLFTSRFSRRYLEMCDDVDDDVVLPIVEMLADIDRLNLLEADSDLSVIERLVFYEGDSRIRRAAAEFVCLQYDAFGVSEQDMTEKQLVTQAVALLEFAEEYMGGDVDSVDMMVSAFWDNEDCQVLQNWHLLTTLLGSDTHDPPLTSEQQTILIKLLTGVVKQIVSDEIASNNQQSKKSRKRDDSEPMTIFFCREIPPLMMRFQSEPEKLCLLLQLVATLNWNATIMNQHKKHVEDLQARLKHAYMTHSDGRFLEELSRCIYHMLESSNTALTRDVGVLVQEILRESVDLCRTLIAQVKTSKTKDVEFGLQAWLARLHYLNGYINYREECPKSDDIHDLLVAFITERCTLDLSNAQLTSTCVRDAMQILLKEFFWHCNPLFEETKEEISSETLDSTIQHIVSMRNELEGILLQVLSIHLKEQVTHGTQPDQVLEIQELEMYDEQVEYVNKLHTTAFQVLSDLRCLCVQRFDESSQPYKQLSFHPHKNLLILSQSFYERMMGNEETPRHVKNSILIALASTSLCNPENKRQAATVLQQMSNEMFQPIVKAFGKRLSTLSIVKYLEIQMVALQQAHDENVELAIELAKSLSHSMSTKLPLIVRGSYLKFMAEGIRFALDTISNGTFVNVLKPYLARVDKAGMKSLHSHMKKLQLLDHEGEELDEAVEEFEVLLSGVKDSKQNVVNEQNEPANDVNPSEQGETSPAAAKTFVKRARNLSDDEDEPGSITPKKSRKDSNTKKNEKSIGNKDEVNDDESTEAIQKRTTRGKRKSLEMNDVAEKNGSTSATKKQPTRSTRSLRSSQSSTPSVDQEDDSSDDEVEIIEKPSNGKRRKRGNSERK